MEVGRVIFQEDGVVHNKAEVPNARQQGQNPPIVQDVVEGKQAQPVLRRSDRVPRPPDRYVPSLDYVMLIDCGEPSCYKEAMLMEDKVKWEKAMQSEMDSLHKNQT